MIVIMIMMTIILYNYEEHYGINNHEITMMINIESLFSQINPNLIENY